MSSIKRNSRAGKVATDESLPPLRREEFSITYGQLLGPASSIEARIFLKATDQDGHVLRWECWEPEAQDCEVGRFATDVPFGHIVRAVVACAEKESLIGPSFPSLRDCIGEWDPDIKIEVNGCEAFHAHWLLLACADFEGERIGAIVSRASESRLRSLAQEHGSLLSAGAIRYFHAAREATDRRRETKTNRLSDAAKPGVTRALDWRDTSGEPTQIELGDLLLELLESWAKSGDPRNSSDAMQFLLDQVAGRGRELVTFFIGTDTYGSRLILSTMRLACIAVMESSPASPVGAMVAAARERLRRDICTEVEDALADMAGQSDT